MHRTLLAATLAAALFSTTPVLEPLWRFLASLWSEAGCELDPNGQCRTGVDAGCHIDPNGRCLPAAQVESGCHLDPDGLCNSASQVESGCHIDPNGRCSS